MTAQTIFNRGTNMGCVANITAEIFPKQGSHLGKRVRACFHYDTTKYVDGEVVRDDMEQPFLTVIRLDDGRHVLATECQYQTI